MKKKAVKVEPGYSVSHCNITNNHPPLPTAHVDAIQRIAEALRENAVSLGKAADALKGPDNNSIGMRLGS